MTHTCFPYYWRSFSHSEINFLAFGTMADSMWWLMRFSHSLGKQTSKSYLNKYLNKYVNKDMFKYWNNTALIPKHRWGFCFQSRLSVCFCLFNCYSFTVSCLEGTQMSLHGTKWCCFLVQMSCWTIDIYLRPLTTTHISYVVVTHGVVLGFICYLPVAVCSAGGWLVCSGIPVVPSGLLGYLRPDCSVIALSAASHRHTTFRFDYAILSLCWCFCCAPYKTRTQHFHPCTWHTTDFHTPCWLYLL